MTNEEERCSKSCVDVTLQGLKHFQDYVTLTI